MFDFHQSFIGGGALFPLLLFGVGLVLGWIALHRSFVATARAVAARATADLASVHAALEGLADRVSRLEAQVGAISEQFGSEPPKPSPRGACRRARRSARQPAGPLPEGATEAPS